jgi:TRAP-type C4-dicarboxylate transport system permease small subunit
MFQQIHRGVRALAYVMAIMGGFVLAAIILMVCASILGRTATWLARTETIPGFAAMVATLGIGPVHGDYELLEITMPFVIFAFLPWCQVTAGHASVDIFTDGLRAWARRVLVAVLEVVFAAVLVLIAVQLYDGMLVQQRRGSTTFLLQIPVWRSYQAATIPAAVAALVACWMALVRLAEAASNRSLIRTEAGAEH